LEHTIGFLLSMSCTRNGNGYDIASQNYFRELSRDLGDTVDPVSRQSVSEARAKLRWEAFEYLLDRANLEHAGLPERFKFFGHVTRALDGTSFFTPASPELLEHFSRRKTKSEEGETHYPYGLCVTAINVFTDQPVAAVVDNYRASERALLKHMIAQFNPGDLALLDRGLGGAQVYLEFDAYGQFFIHRAKTTGDRVAGYVARFLESGKNQKTVKINVKDEETGMIVTLKLRLILGPLDSEGKPIVFVTNLRGKNRYPRESIVELYARRWGVETMYNRVKNLLSLESFHARTYNGVMQEIFSNLLVLSLAAAASSCAIDEHDMDPDEVRPNFKNATEVVRRHLFAVVDHRIVGEKPKKLLKQIIEQVAAKTYKIRPGRSYPRVSMQPIQSWNLKKSAKLRAFQQRNA
jgi:DDE family transposase